MKVIFKKTNEVKNVSSGYALNFLIPQGLAVLGTEEEIKKLGIKKLREDRIKTEKEKKDMELARQLSGKQVVIKVKTGKNGKLFGAINEAKVYQALGINSNKIEVILEKPIKKIGRYQIDLKIGSKKARIDLLVESQKDKK